MLQTKTVPNEIRTVKKGEQVRLVTWLTKGWDDKKVFTVNLDGEGASFIWFIFVFGSGKEKFSFDLHVNHHAKKTKSRIYARSVLRENAAVEFNGVSRIDEHAKKSDAYCSFHTLLLSPDARAQTIPSLEILTEDVVAGHAASVDRFLPGDLFYLETRGLQPEESYALLTKSFFGADLVHLSEEALRTALTKKITAITASFT